MQGRSAIEPTTDQDRMAESCRRLAVAGCTAERQQRRRFAIRYRRDISMLLYWTFAASRTAVIRAGADQENPSATRALCARLYRDLQDAKALPHFYRRRPARIGALRDLFTAECHLYAMQTARAEAQTEMNDFLRRLAV